MKKNTKILVCCHKKDVMATQDPYLPIHVGKVLHKEVELGITTDYSGVNISEKNESYCELTGLYWAWKNLKDVDIIGLCHYRRYFDFHGQGKSFLPYTSFETSYFDQLDFSIPENILNKVNSGEIVVSKPKSYRYSIYSDYCREHISDDLKILAQVINETQPDIYQSAFTSFFHHNNKLSHFNMFVMKWADFDSYCSWLFAILEECEKRIDITNYNSVQKRIFGYMAERLFNVWLIANKKKTIKTPVLWIHDGEDELSHYNRLSYKLRVALDTLGNKLMYSYSNNAK